MNCSKIGGPCPYPVKVEPKFIFVIMPFDGFDSVYDTIKQAISQFKKPKFIIERADERYTNVSIWCSRICKNIRKANYCIADTTGKNANVFYELGFAHALSQAKTIILTQNINETPFDVREIGHIIYSEKNLPKLRKDIISALTDLYKEEQLIEKIEKNNLKNITFSNEELDVFTKRIKDDIIDELIKDSIVHSLIDKKEKK